MLVHSGIQACRNSCRIGFKLHKNKMIRFVLKLDPRSHIGSDEFKSLGRLPVSKRVDQIILNHSIRIKSGTSPDYMGEHYIPATSVHKYSTRFGEMAIFFILK